MVEVQSINTSSPSKDDKIVGGSNERTKPHIDLALTPLTPTSPTFDISSSSESEDDNNMRHDKIKQRKNINTSASSTMEETPTSDRPPRQSKHSAPMSLTVPFVLQQPTLPVKQVENRKTEEKSSENKEAILESRIAELESSLKQVFQLLANQEQKSNTSTPALSGISSHNLILSSAPKEVISVGTHIVEPDQHNDLESRKKVETPPAIEYRSFSPTYEEGLRREIQSRSRSNSLVDSEQSSTNNSNKASNESNETNVDNSSMKQNESNKNDSSGKPPRPRRLSKTSTSLSSEDANNKNLSPSSNQPPKAAQPNATPKNLDSSTTSNQSSSDNQMLSEPSQFSILNYIKTEMLGEGVTQTTPKTSISIQQTDARMEEFLRVPFNLEYLLFFGFAICIDCYLYVLTFLPLKFLWSIFRGTMTLFFPKTTTFRFHRRHMYQLLQMSIIYVVYAHVLSRIQIGMLYHWIRGQAMIKLYVLIAMVEVFDRLMCAFGQDSQDSLYWNTIMRPRTKRIFVSWLVVLVYATIHSLILFVHVATLNVAMNSADHALLTLLVSGNFAEIKSTVFKKYNTVVLFNITMSDICERFKLALFLMVILLLNISQGGVTVDTAKNYWWMCTIVLIAELTADWIKHSFIAKLNYIESKAYREYALVLARDVTGMGHEGINFNHTHAVVKRIGFAQFPLVCVMARYLREAGRYAWMRSNKTYMLDEWFCYWKSFLPMGQICVVEKSEWKLRHSAMAFGYVLIWYLSLLTLKIVFGYILQMMARKKLLNDISSIGQDATAGNTVHKLSKSGSKVDTSTSSTGGETKQNRQRI